MKGDRTQGRRVLNPFHPYGGLIAEWPLPGDYWYDSREGWRGVTPDDQQAGLRNHQVAQHADGTITVSPSILVGGGHGPSWHGYLERGVWREV